MSVMRVEVFKPKHNANVYVGNLCFTSLLCLYMVITDDNFLL